jgi:hypothetical protein
MEFYGVDVSKDALDIACSDGSLVRIENSKKAIKSFLRGMPKGCCIAMSRQTGITCSWQIPATLPVWWYTW